MAMTAKRIAKTTDIQACINCAHYRQYFQLEPIKGESCKALKPVDTGWCQRFGKQRGAFRKPCTDYISRSEQDSA